VRLDDVLAAAGVRDAVGVEHLQRLQDVLPVVGHVVGDADHFDIPRLQRQHALRPRMPPAALVWNVLLRPFGFDQHPLEVRVHEIRPFQRLADVCERGRRIGAQLNVDVADDQHRQRLVAERAAPRPGGVSGGERRD
jgi:hypothetical protein